MKTPEQIKAELEEAKNECEKVKLEMYRTDKLYIIDALQIKLAKLRSEITTLQWVLGG